MKTILITGIGDIDHKLLKMYCIREETTIQNVLRAHVKEIANIERGKNNVQGMENTAWTGE